MNDQRAEIAERLKYLGEKSSEIKIKHLPLDKYSSKRIVSTPFLNFDYSKQRLSDEALDWLITIPDKLKIRDSFQELLDGNFINPTEERKVSHTLYRAQSDSITDKFILNERNKFNDFLSSLKTEGNVKNIICLGIGGSRLGPELLCEFQSNKGPFNVFFCSSYDLLELKAVLELCKQEETIVIASSKSFTTSEVLKNLRFVKDWYKENQNLNLIDYLYGISADPIAMDAFGIKKENQFLLLQSLGGRYSIWSSISLPAFVNSDFESYLNFLEGANLADQYVLESEWIDNISMMMALISVWNASALDISNHGIFTYDFRLRSFATYISQLIMESNGKSINSESNITPFSATPLIWGGYGVNSQHSTFQWILQGKTISSCDFIGLNFEGNISKDSYQMLLSQVLALTVGEENKKEPFKSVDGNNPCSVIQLNSISLKSLGFLIALYEHKVFFEAQILGIDPFDQWGVELGKKIASNFKNSDSFLSNYFSDDLLPKT